MANHQYQGLLEYDSQYRGLICTQCRYAIQPTAISRHLKDLHHIYRSEKKHSLDATSKLKLSDPAELEMPPTNSLPIKHLPVEGGVACTHRKCNHLCVTVKRMKRHWGTAHGITGVEDVNWSPVKLRTFFRGKELLYFIADAAGKDDSSSYNYLCYEPPSVTKYPATRTCQRRSSYFK